MNVGEHLEPGVSAAVSGAVARCAKLPVLDASLRRILDRAASDETTIAELVDAIEADFSLAANILRFSNSAGNIRRDRAKTVRQAVTMTGRRNVRRLALDAVAYDFFERAPGNGGVSRGHLHLHSVQVAHVAARCAELAGLPADDAHLAGLFHDCGKLVLPLAFGEERADAIAAQNPHGSMRAQAERAAFGVDHAEAGAILAAASGVPGEVVRAIARHHSAPEADKTAACVQLAHAVVDVAGGGSPDADHCGTALSLLGLPESALADLAAAIEPAKVAEAGAPAQRVGEMQRNANVDDLTGLATRRHWLDEVGALVAGGAEGSVIACDIDGFDAINRNYDRRAGDRVLCEVARIAARHGVAGRIRDDLFAVWVPGDPFTGVAAARALSDEVRRGRSESRPDDQPPPVTVSVGTAATVPGAIDVPRLLVSARCELYEARLHGLGGAAEDAPA